MFERGITDTKADIWTHLFPNDSEMFWYWVRHMKNHIRHKKMISTIGKSKDGTTTGKGYLVLKTEPFIAQVPVPKKLVEAFDWDNGTDRQKGLIWGEQVLEWMIALKYWSPPLWHIHKFRTKTRQFKGGDFQLSVFTPLIELKTEFVKSQNIFVQTNEEGHRVHQIKDESGAIQTRFTSAPGLM